MDGGRVEQSAQVLQELLRLFLGFLLLDSRVEPALVESRGGAVTELVCGGGEILTRTGSTKIEFENVRVDNSEVNLAMKKTSG